MADFIFIDRDIFRTSDPQQIRETRVLETYLGGTQVWTATPVRARGEEGR